MNNEILFLFEKYTDTPIQQTKTQPQETLEYKMKGQFQTFSNNPPLNLLQEGK